ncbi:UNVERIFIED_CONTAM: hypothetical protein HDU68_008244 [Siphonaria sp. JEL0065]|nr:hypothetical protein HDU68_008244 [Siphonaria sp. JEL0065]
MNTTSVKTHSKVCLKVVEMYSRRHSCLPSQCSQVKAEMQRRRASVHLSPPALVSPSLDSDNEQVHFHSSVSDAWCNETFFGYVRNTVDCYLLVEAVVAGVLKPCSASAGIVRSGSVLVIPLDSAKAKFVDNRYWSSARPQDNFKVTREAELVDNYYEALKSRNDMNGRGNIFPFCPPRPGMRIIHRGLVKRSLSMNGSNGQLFRVISYAYQKDVEHLFNTKASAHRSLLLCPSQIPQYQQFISQWVQYNKLRKMREQMESELQPLPPSVFPIEELPQQPEDNWELTATPQPQLDYDEYFNLDELDSLLMPLALPPSILPINQPKDVSLEQIRSQVLQYRQQQLIRQ